MLGVVERLVGALQCLVQAASGADQCHADADGDAVGHLHRGRPRRGFDGAAQPLRHPARAGQVVHRHDGDEFLAAIAGQQRIVAHVRLQRRRGHLQHLVAGGVAIGVVDDLEVVGVEHQHRDVALPLPGEFDRGRRQFAECTPRHRSGQFVGDGAAAQLLAQPGVDQAEQQRRDHHRHHAVQGGEDRLQILRYVQQVHLRRPDVDQREGGARPAGHRDEQQAQAQPPLHQVARAADEAASQPVQQRGDGGQQQGVDQAEAQRPGQPRQQAAHSQGDGQRPEAGAGKLPALQLTDPACHQQHPHQAAEGERELLLSLVNARLRQQLRSRAITDELTGTMTRRRSANWRRPRSNSPGSGSATSRC